jgi:hypothetical protein
MIDIDTYLQELFGRKKKKNYSKNKSPIEAKKSEYEDKLLFGINLKIIDLFREGVCYIIDEIRNYYLKNTNIDEDDLNERIFGWGGNNSTGETSKGINLTSLYKAHKKNIDAILNKHISILKTNIPKVKGEAKTYIETSNDFKKFLKDNNTTFNKKDMMDINDYTKNYSKGMKQSNNDIINYALAIDWITGKTKDIYKSKSLFFNDHDLRHMHNNY